MNINKQIETLRERMLTDDCRSTSDPLFTVREDVKVHGVEDEHSDGYVWYDELGNDDERYTDEELYEAYPLIRDDFRGEDSVSFGTEETEDDEGHTFHTYVKDYYKTIKKTVQTFFTEHCMNHYIRNYAHQHTGQLSTYVTSAHANDEMKLVRKILMEATITFPKEEIS